VHFGASEKRQKTEKTLIKENANKALPLVPEKRKDVPVLKKNGGPHRIVPNEKLRKNR